MLTESETTTLSPSGVAASTLQAEPRLVRGQVFGPYRIGRLLGRGGMGEVYEAEHVEQGRRVALKVLNQRLAAPQDRARFLRQGQLAASITHPNSVYIFGSDEIAGTPVIAMELLAGGTLKDRVTEHGPLPPAQAVDAILQVIAGLDAAHAGGVLHRDIKPANCFIDGDHTVKIGDFGLSISTAARDMPALTMAGTFYGTPEFAPPEQMRGEPLDVRADIYAVGATLYYLLTGRPPFDDHNLMALVTRIATEVPRSPHALAPGVPRDLAAIVLRCLAKDRSARPATYAGLTDALRPFSSAAPTPASLGRRALVGIVDMSRFPTAGHLVSWAGLCPRLDESAGKRRSTRIRHATPWLKTTLIQAAWAAGRVKESDLRAQFLRLKSRRGPKKAIVAVAASMLTAAYFMIRDDVDYHDLGGRYFTDRDKTPLTRSLIRRLRDLGVNVEIKAA